jgi:shikimate dehydrogenase
MEIQHRQSRSPEVLLSGETRLLGVVGHPVGHSLSPRMHNASFAADGVDYVYVPMDVEPGRLSAAVEGMVALGFRGFNVTMPHKEAVIRLLDELDDAARISGAVNTVVIEESGRRRGFNTDGGGFVEACAEAGVELSGRHVLILGAGGAAAAVAVAVLGEGVGRLTIANRTAVRAERLRGRLLEAERGAEIGVLPIEALQEEAGRSDVVINTTYLGMKEYDPLPFPPGSLEEVEAVCDAVYRPGGETELIRRARESGVKVVPGGRMLLYQGVQAQRLWTGREPNVEAMSDAVL